MPSPLSARTIVAALGYERIPRVAVAGTAVAWCGVSVFLVPVVAGISSALWTGERFSGPKLASAAVVLLGLALARMGKPREETAV